MKVLITGATGFLGSYIVQQFVQADHEVSVFDIQPASAGPSPVPETVTWHQGDITRPESIREVVVTTRPETIVHLAGLLQFGCMENPRAAITINVLGTSNMLEAAREAGVRRVVAAFERRGLRPGQKGNPGGFAPAHGYHPLRRPRSFWVKSSAANTNKTTVSKQSTSDTSPYTGPEKSGRPALPRC